MVEDPVLTTAFEILTNEDGNATIEDLAKALQGLKMDSSTEAKHKLIAALYDLGITQRSIQDPVRVHIRSCRMTS